MKQILQDLTEGHTMILEAPVSQLSSEKICINTHKTLISAGTERMLVDFGKASYLQKIKQQPDKVKMVLDKVKTDGLMATFDAVSSKLSQPLPLGYCHVGVVEAVGKNVDGFQKGDRVVSNGPHADVVTVFKNLCARIPDNVDDDSAAFTVVTSIALQGVRLAQLTLGECVAVIGVGLIGLLTVQLLIAQGCRVLAIDFDQKKLSLAKSFGAEICCLNQKEDPILIASAFSRNRGVDAVLITASTSSNDPISQAAQMSRKRGRIILVGVTGLQLNRSEFYEKELTFQVSCSYGPGRYDPTYEEKGIDYPVAFVRWTEQRNFEACLDLMASKQLDLNPLITHRYLFEDAVTAYETLTSDVSALGILLEYTSEKKSRHKDMIDLSIKPKTFQKNEPVLGFIGAGNYASRVLLPAFKKANAQCHTIVTSGGLSGVVVSKINRFVKAASNEDYVFKNSDINTVVIATRHDSHASLVIKALKAEKHVFVEKPLAINLRELDEIESIYHQLSMENPKIQLMVGFNRRFSPLTQKMKKLLDRVKEPKIFIMTVNAGAIPSTHWTQDSKVGGGRIIGEGCHFIDLMRYLSGSSIVASESFSMGQSSHIVNQDDKVTIQLSFQDGSMGTIHYLANGSSQFPKERLEVFTAGRILQLDNFKKLIGYGWSDFKKMQLWRQNKGQNECVASFLKAIKSGESLIPVHELFETARVAIHVAHQAE